MKLRIVTALLLSILTVPTWAADCTNAIAKFKKQQKHFDSINYVHDYVKATDDKRSEIDDEASIALGDAMEDFNKIPSHQSCRVDAWKALIDLIIATAPYDKDSSGANFIAKHGKNTKLYSIYLNHIQNSGELCRRKFISAMVAESLCMMVNEKRANAPEICIPKDRQEKDLSNCLSSTQKAEKSGARDEIESASFTAAQL